MSTKDILAKRIRLGVLVSATLVAISNPAAAGHGRAGMWHRTGEMHSNVSALAMALGPRAGAEYEKAFQRSFSSDYCQSTDDVAHDVVPIPLLGCAMDETSVSGATITSHYKCSDGLLDRGTVSITYDSDTHYTGELTFLDTYREKWRGKFEGVWQADSCLLKLKP